MVKSNCQDAAYARVSMGPSALETPRVLPTRAVPGSQGLSHCPGPAVALLGQGLTDLGGWHGVLHHDRVRGGLRMLTGTIRLSMSPWLCNSNRIVPLQFTPTNIYFHKKFNIMRFASS